MAEDRKDSVEFGVSTVPEMGIDGRPTEGIMAPVELEEPELGSERMIVNVGPQHPATHGVLRLLCELDGETVIRCTPYIGYLHSSFEKLGEYREWNQVVPLTDRMDYLSPVMYNCAYVMAVEKLMGLEVTDKCRYTRIIFMEMNRILAHLLWLATWAMDVGAFTPFLYAFQQREEIYSLHEAFTGARITTSATRVGGMMADMPEGWPKAVREWTNQLPRTLDEIDALLKHNNIHVGRAQDVGTISAEDAISCGLSGACLRASGVPYDVRKDNPYYGYDTFDFEVPVGEHGDCYDRYLVRVEEMRQACRIIHQALDRLDENGRMNVDDPRVVLPSKTDCMNDMESMIHHFKLIMEGVQVPEGESYFPVEGAKGELGMYVVSEGGDKPIRWRVRPPAFLNLSAISRMVEGGLLSDVIIVNASLDIVLGEIDR